MLARWIRRRLGWVVVGTSAGVLAIISSAAALYKLDLEQFRADPERLSKLHRAPLLGGSSGSSQSGEWPQWRGPNRDGLSLETGLIRAWPKDGPPLRWQRFVGRGVSAPLIAQVRVY